MFQSCLTMHETLNVGVLKSHAIEANKELIDSEVLIYWTWNAVILQMDNLHHSIYISC